MSFKVFLLIPWYGGSLLLHSLSMGLFQSEVKVEDATSPVPGTVHLVDLDGTMQAQHAKGTGRSDIVLVPAPSSDPDDPVGVLTEAGGKNSGVLKTLTLCYS